MLCQLLIPDRLFTLKTHIISPSPVSLWDILKDTIFFHFDDLLYVMIGYSIFAHLEEHYILLFLLPRDQLDLNPQPRPCLITRGATRCQCGHDMTPEPITWEMLLSGCNAAPSLFYLCVISLSLSMCVLVFISVMSLSDSHSLCLWYDYIFISLELFSFSHSPATPCQICSSAGNDRVPVLQGMPFSWCFGFINVLSASLQSWGTLCKRGATILRKMENAEMGVAEENDSIWMEA